VTGGSRALTVLICRVKSRLCALPVDRVAETMRPLPVEPVAGAPRFVRGVAIVRGEPVAVVDAALLLCDAEAQPARFVVVRAGVKRVALAVDSVVGIRALPPGSLRDCPPLLGEIAGEVVSAIGASDDQLLVVLQSARLVPESVWATL
jgi:purine-binding chemotaxis protein CheW